jgi:hypothetical protein
LFTASEEETFREVEAVILDGPGTAFTDEGRSSWKVFDEVYVTGNEMVLVVLGEVLESSGADNLGVLDRGDVLRGGPAVQVAVDPSVTLRPVRGGK